MMNVEFLFLRVKIKGVNDLSDILTNKNHGLREWLEWYVIPIE